MNYPKPHAAKHNYTKHAQTWPRLITNKKLRACSSTAQAFIALHQLLTMESVISSVPRSVLGCHIYISQVGLRATCAVSDANSLIQLL
jgi:hypothetical protein